MLYLQKYLHIIKKIYIVHTYKTDDIHMAIRLNY